MNSEEAAALLTSLVNEIKLLIEEAGLPPLPVIVAVKDGDRFHNARTMSEEDTVAFSITTLSNMTGKRVVLREAAAPWPNNSSEARH